MALEMVTLFVDASFDHKACVSGWGAWSKHASWDYGKTFGGAVFEVTTSNEAEYAAIAAAILRLESLIELKGKALLVQSDNVRALQLVQHAVGAAESRHKNGASLQRARPISPSPREQVTEAVLKGMREAERLSVVMVRHVRGHTSGGGRQWVNRECDRIARQHLASVR